MAEPFGVVYKQGIPAATLRAAGSQVTFSYLDDYLASDRPGIATTLPKSLGSITLPGGASPAYFAGLLPEGRRLNGIAKRLKTSVDNDLPLLIALGADAVGDVQVLDPTATATSHSISIPRKTSRISFRQILEEHFDSPAAGLPGFQDKISSKMLNAPAKKMGLEFILKFNSPEAPHAVENEFFFLTLARACGLRTANFELLTDRDGLHALQLERFDRRVLDGTTTRLGLEDACQVLNLYPSQKYEIATEVVFEALIGLCSSEAVAASELFKQLVFDYLIGNGDAHAKNFSILQEPSGEWRVSPAYDLLSTLYYEDQEMALSLDGTKSGWTRSMLVAFAKKLGLPESYALRTMDGLIQATTNLPTMLDSRALPFRRDQNYKASKRIRSRLKALAPSE